MAQSHFLFGGFSQTLEQGRIYLSEALDAASKHSYSVFWDRSVKAWLSVWRSYKDIKSTLRDAGRAFVLFIAILFPAAILVERMVQPSSSNKRLLLVLAYMAAAFVVLYFVHPGFSIISNPFMITLGLIIVALAIPLVYVIAAKMSSSLKAYRIESMGKHVEETSRNQTMWISLNMGCGYIRKRPMRMALCMLSIIIITVAMVSLMSFSSLSAVRSAETRMGQTNYSGVLIISDLGSDPIQPQIVEALQIEYGYKALVAPRAYMWAGMLGAPGGGTYGGLRLSWNLKYRDTHNNNTVLTTLGLTPQEAEVSSLDEAILPGGRWFIETDYDTCIISDVTANALGITSLPAKITWESAEYTVIGIFDSKKVNEILDLNQQTLTPPDVWSTPFQGAAVTRVDAANTMFISYKKALSLDAQVFSVGVAFPHLTSQELDEQAVEIFMKFRRLTYLGKDGHVSLYSQRSLTSVLGWEHHLVPIILGSLTIMNLLLSSVQERTKEIATLSSVGLSPLQILTLFLAEALVYAVVGNTVGYMAGVALGHYSSVISATPELHVNYGSTASLSVIPITIAFILVSTIYPAIKASKVVTPSMERKWKVSAKSKGDEWEISLPFTTSGIKKTLGIINYLEEYLKSHMIPHAEDFKVENIEKKTESNAVTLIAVVRLLPYEQGIIQRAVIKGSRPIGMDRYVFHIHVKRIQGDINLWQTSNRIFFDCVRKQFLLWQSLKDEEQDKYAK